jgi:hypothetical protein
VHEHVGVGDGFAARSDGYGTEPRTAITPATRVRPVTMTALAAKTVRRRGVAVRVRRIMPVPYSPLTAVTAKTAMIAWPR